MDFSSAENADNKTQKEIKNCQDNAETVDPDYVSVLPEKNQSKASLSEQQQDAKENAIQKIKNIVRHQFALEMHLKEQEIETIDQRIHQTKAALDRLRACVLARYYGMSQAFQNDKLIRRSAKRTRTNYNSVMKAVKIPRSIQLNNTVSLSNSSVSISNTKDLGNGNPLVTTTSILPTSLLIKPTNTSIPCQKDSLNLSSDKNKTLSSAASNFVKTEKSPSSTKLGMTNGETVRASRLTNLPHELSASESSSQSGSVVDSKRNPASSSVVMGNTTKGKIDKITKGNQSTVTSDILGSHILVAGSGGSGIPLNVSGTQSKASSQTCSNLVHTQAKTMKSQSIALGLQGALKNVQGSQLNALGLQGTLKNVQGSQSSALGLQEALKNVQGSQSSALGVQGALKNVQESQLNALGLQGALKNVQGSQSSALGVQGGLKNVQGALNNVQGCQLSGSTNLKDAQSQSNAFGSGSRFYVKKRIIIGNTSKYIAPEKREENDKSTHKWMVYVRGPPEDPHIDTYIQKVWFFLHPSYRPNDIIEINRPPFQLTRRGWGEFPIRVQLHFVGARNKRVDIIHELKLDKTYTGLQTLGAETVVDLEIDRKTFEDLGIPVSFEVHQESETGDDAKSNIGTPALKLDIKSNTNQGISKVKREHPSDATGTSSSDAGQLPSLAFKKPRIETPLSSVATTSCGSPNGSRCTSPVLATKVNFFIEDGLEEHLHNFAKKIPLIASKKDVVNLPFSALSAEVFLSSNVGKRRAAEWQRAARIRAKIAKCVENTKITTKGVMMWCRRFGYTPRENLVMNDEAEYCKICGKLIEQDTLIKKSDPGVASPCTDSTCAKLFEKELSSLTSLDEILKEIEEKQRLLNEISRQRDNDADEDNFEIDVVGSSNTKKSTKIIMYNLPGMLSIPLTYQQEWIRDVCNDVGIGLRPVVIQGVKVNVIESILFKIAMKFVENVLRKASSLSVKTESALVPKIIVPLHIYQAIRAVYCCDFLSNSHFGHASEDQT